MKVFRDQLNRKIEVKGTPRRIVSLVPSQTELLVDLGLREQIFGVTKFCVHPRDLRKEKKIVGGTKKVHFDRIAALKPDIILCNKEENTEEMVTELEKIAPVHVSDIKSIDDSLELIFQYGEIFGVTAKASEIAEKITLLRSQFQEDMHNLPVRKVAYFIWKDPWMVAGKDTFIDHLLQLNKLQNVFSEEDSRYPEINLGDLGQKKVDLLLLSTEPYPFKEDHVQALRNEVGKARVQIVDGEYFSWYGSRLTAAFTYFRQLQENFS
ncbi:ABC-type Fe3+-hydroxamate transport system, substrate-binding protein [Salinimicrobium sediminis]|uniref:ABC-type Fe3+-hydroxamate transport system, substrate-binding protein n=1 Tax=Salinimicrobium sediminis TaxID=1343891 RepID=A0A285WZV2_9FLAO|nr:helical backbone metal receptor [Salinimicrobium sediminis]SOC78650.1 ABC-type Fe3+-hydroxamate transport system, substrate-binding protein [Salinimicrobium sediminis]